MAEKITPRKKDFSQWYQDIVLQARLADYSPIKGCMVIRPNGYSIWEAIQNEFNARLRKKGVRNAYFPLFIPESFLKKEAEHVEGFAPECAVVTHAGGKPLEEQYVVRPTSETMINTMFSKWIQSYRDLPFLINQWANVVRWEMRTRLFLRTTEFLWQEGHTCHATAKESDAYAKEILMMYQEFLETVLAMPVLTGKKSESEKFPGALNTFAVEALMQDGKALQAGTSHDLSTNFSIAFDTKYQSKEGQELPVHQTSWGVSTRLIGGMVMTHSDDRGLVLPPRVAHHQVVLIPIFGKAAKDPVLKKKLLDAVESIRRSIEEAAARSSLGYPISVMTDTDDSKQPGWKFHEYEVTGVPIRIELGPRDLEQGQVMMARRDRDQKEAVSMDQVAEKAIAELGRMQIDLLAAAKQKRAQATHQVSNWKEFQEKIEAGGFIEAAWCGDREIENKIKNETKATIRVLPLDEKFQTISTDAPCVYSGKAGGNVRAIFARSY